MMHALAFIIWDVGSRAPSKLVADVFGGFSSARTLGRGLWRFVLGALLLLAGALLMLSATVVDIRGEFEGLETGAILTGLLIEILIGEPIRRHLRER